jgi:hypothetical protein
MPSSATLQTPFSPKFHNLPLDYFYSATLAPFYSALDTSLAQQPDASATITRTLFVGLAMIESLAIYCFVVSMILIFANPFWTHVIAQAAGKK